MDRAIRYDDSSSGTSFSRRGSSHLPSVYEENRTLDLFVKFKHFQPFLKARLKKIYSDHKERECKDEIDDIKYFLAVMQDMSADENHGADALQGFIDRIHEMVRKFPMEERPQQSDNNDTDDSYPRSPSPVTFQDDSINMPRPIPVERRDFNYSVGMEDDVERSIRSDGYERTSREMERGDQHYSNTSPWEFDDSSYSRRPTRDVDMRMSQSAQWAKPSQLQNQGFQAPFDSLFERRPTSHAQPANFERRQPSSSEARFRVIGSSSGAVRFDYNHGSTGWDTDSSSSSSVDRDLRFQPHQQYQNQNIFDPANGFDTLNRPIFQHQQSQGFARPYDTRPQLYEGFNALNPFLNQNVRMNQSGAPPIRTFHPNQQRYPRTPTASLPREIIPGSHLDVRPGLLGARPVLPPNVPSTASFASSSLGVMENLSHNSVQSHTDPRFERDRDPSAMTPERMKQMIKQKAQQHFGRFPAHKRDHQNTAQVPPGSQRVQPPQRSPQESLLASNQMLSERDPRVNRERENRISVQGSGHRQHPGGDKSAERHELDPRQLPRDKEKHEKTGQTESSRRLDWDRHHSEKDRDKADKEKERERTSRYHSHVTNESRSAERASSTSLDGTSDVEDARSTSKDRASSGEQRKTSGSKLQEIRKQVETFHPLGRSGGSSKNQSNFDEAIVVPVEASTRHSHPSIKQKDKDAKDADGVGSKKEKERKETAKRKEDKKAKRDKSRRKDGSPDKERLKSNRDKEFSPKRRSLSSKSSRLRTHSVASSDEAKPDKSLESECAPKKAVFRIPKIKKPSPPPPPPRSPSPELPEELEGLASPDNDTLPESTQERSNHLSRGQEHRKEGGNRSGTEKKITIPEDLITKFIIEQAESNPTFSDKLAKKPELIDVFKANIIQQLTRMVTEEQEEPSNTAEPEEDGAVNDIDQGEEGDQEHEEEDIELGGHRSRSRTRKKNTKRRSSLEKLQDALKEMRFDTMLPLGPRRCTRGHGDDGGNLVSETSYETALMPPPISQTSRTSGSRRGSGKSNEAATKPTSALIETTGEDKSVTSGKKVVKKSMKRKRSASKGKPNKKKKGPVTRAQVAVKVALKMQQKEKASPIAVGTLATPPPAPRPRGRPKRAKGPASAVAAKKRKIVKKKGPDVELAPVHQIKIKTETNVKEEPEDRSYEDVTAGEGMDGSGEHMDALVSAEEPPYRPPVIIVHGDVEGMSIDIVKLEREDDLFLPPADTNYNTYLDLPDIPVIEYVYSLAPEIAVGEVLQALEKECEKPESPPSQDVDGEIRKQCYGVLDSLITDIEDQSESMAAESPENKTEKETLKDDDEAQWVVMSFSSPCSEEEPNDFVIQCPFSESEQENAREPKCDEFSESVQKTEDKVETGLPPIMMEVSEFGQALDDVEHCEEELTIESLKAWEEIKPSDEEKTEDEDKENQQKIEDDGTLEDSLPSIQGDSPATKSRRALVPPPPDVKIVNLEGCDLYKCSYCPGAFSTATEYQEHVFGCRPPEDSKSLECPHCHKRVKTVTQLLEHLKHHGPQKLRCSLCPWKTSVPAELTRHLKSFHKVFNQKVDTLESNADPYGPDTVAFPKDVFSRISNLTEFKERYPCYANRLVYGPDDINKLPQRPIFHTNVYCSKCPYGTKVLVNFVRHLSLHKNAKDTTTGVVPVSDPVNPVPCLERKELMFDKMTNWAGSTHENKQNASNDNASVPQFVSEQFRYVCPVCEQITVDDHMLRTHLRALHPETELYICPHCHKQEGTKNDSRNTVPVDRLGGHLKLHGPKLYRCAYCDVVHTQVTHMEKHLPEKHPERKPIHYLIRNLDGDGNPANRRSSTDETPTERWRCGLCGTKQLFTSYAEVKNHCTANHRIGTQFMCSYCRFGTDDDEQMIVHIQTECKISPESRDVKIMIFWFRHEFEMKPEDIVHGPIWRRAGQVRHIRGIFLEDVKERIPRAPQERKVSSTEKIVAPTGGKTQRRPYKPSGPTSASKLSASAVSNVADRRVSVEDLSSFTCPKCNRFKTKSVESMRVHLYNELGYQRYRCVECLRKFITESSLRGHMEGDHNMTCTPETYELLPSDHKIEDYIENYFAGLDELRDAAAKDHSGPSEAAEGTVSKPPSLWKCKHCNQECQTSHNLKFHLMAKHLSLDRFKCNHCSSSFWSFGVAKGHSQRFHKDMPVSIKENYPLMLSPQFWAAEYGIAVPVKKKTKRSLSTATEEDPVTESALTTEDLLKIPDIVDFPDGDGGFFDSLATMGDIMPSMDEDNKLSLSNATNGSGSDDNLLQQILGDGTAGKQPSSSERKAHLAYKCFHCGEHTLGLRGVRSHWEKQHLKNVNERCIYYEYKAINGDEELPQFLQLCCCYCEYVVSSVMLIRNHHEFNHPEQRFKLKKRIKTGNVSFECAVCFHEAPTKDEVVLHLQTHPNLLESKENYIITNVRRAQDERLRNFYGRLVEDYFVFVCEDQLCAEEFATLENYRNHMITAHQVVQTTSSLKYTRHILNHRVQIPMDGDLVPKVLYKCPKCPFSTDVKSKLITEHLGEHVHTYICSVPGCNKTFRNYVDTKFHIRLEHACPKATPMINYGMLDARQLLEREIIVIRGRRPSYNLQ